MNEYEIESGARSTEGRRIHGVCSFSARMHFSRRNFEKALKNIKEVVEISRGEKLSN